MNYEKYLFILSVFFVSSISKAKISENSVYSNKKCNVKLKNLHAENLKINGDVFCFDQVFFKNTEINGELNIIGNFIGSKMTLNNLFIIGDVNLSKNSIVNGLVNILGELNSIDTKFLNKIMINSSKVSLFKGTYTKDIQFIKNSADLREEYLYVDESVVSGNVIFESGRGHVIIKNNGKIIGGVIGGVILEDSNERLFPVKNL